MRSVVITMVLGSFMGWSTAVFAEETSVLKDVSTSVAGGHTKASFQFAGDVRFSTEQARNGVKLVFTRTTAATAQVLSRHVLNAGPLESIVFQRPATDCIVAVLTFAPGSTYRCICPASGNELYVDVKGTAAVRQVAAPKPAPVATAPVHAAVVPPPRPETERQSPGSSLIDIAAVARQQVELEGAADPHAARTASGPGSMSMPSLVIVSVVVSVAMTGLVLLAFSRIMRREASVVPVTASAQVVPAAPAAKVRAYQQSRVEEEYDDMKPEPDRVRALFGAPVREEEVEEDAGRETSLQLARSFRRGSEEITLARKFHERPAPALTTAKMQSVMARATTKTQRLSAARKLGVGRGEFDLAEKLKVMSQPPVKTEEEKA